MLRMQMCLKFARYLFKDKKFFNAPASSGFNFVFGFISKKFSISSWISGISVEQPTKTISWMSLFFKSAYLITPSTHDIVLDSIPSIRPSNVIRFIGMTNFSPSIQLINNSTLSFDDNDFFASS